MAKVSMVQRDVKRARMAKNQAAKRAELKAIVANQELPFDQRMAARDALNKMPTNGSSVRMHNRCALTGRPHGFFRQFRLSRIMVRDLASKGMLPGVKKASL